MISIRVTTAFLSGEHSCQVSIPASSAFLPVQLSYQLSINPGQQRYQLWSGLTAHQQPPNHARAPPPPLPVPHLHHQLFHYQLCHEPRCNFLALLLQLHLLHFKRTNRSTCKVGRPIGQLLLCPTHNYATQQPDAVCIHNPSPRLHRTIDYCAATYTTPTRHSTNPETTAKPQNHLGYQPALLWDVLCSRCTPNSSG